MNDNVVNFTGLTKLDIPLERILEVAKENVKDVVLIGWDKEEELYFA